MTWWEFFLYCGAIVLAIVLWGFVFRFVVPYIANMP